MSSSTRRPARTSASATGRKQAGGRRYRWVGQAFFWTSIAIVVLGILPIVVNAIAGLAAGTLPDDGILGDGPGYPLFQPPFVVLWLPAIAMLVLSIATFSLPMARWLVGARFDMSMIALIGLGTTLAAAAAYGGPNAAVVAAAALPFAAAMVVFAVRGVLGWFDVLPAHWRTESRPGRR